VPEKHDIQFEHVDFGYEKDMVLHDVSASFPPNAMTAIIGPSGSGKSTMLRLIAWSYDPQKKGVARFGTIDEKSIDPESYIALSLPALDRTLLATERSSLLLCPYQLISEVSMYEFSSMTSVATEESIAQTMLSTKLPMYSGQYKNSALIVEDD